MKTKPNIAFAMLKQLITLSCLLFSFATHAQKILKGVVLDEKNTPVPKASVFLNNTSIGTSANEEGKFTLTVPAGKFDLIVSSVGYTTYNQTIITNEITSTDVTIRLKLKAPDLEAVIIEPYEKDGWEKWGKWFIENFIGVSSFGRDCRILNPDVLRFRNSKKKNELSAIALAPLIIENKALGYRVTYQLENFRFDFKSRYLLYTGYPFFEPMQGSERKQRKWEKAREEAYYGSTLQFMRALYRNRIAEEGFEVRRLKKVPNAEKQRVKAVRKGSVHVSDSKSIVFTINRDSGAYYDRIMAEDDFKNVIGSTALPGDSIAYAFDSTTAGFDFPDYLLVICKNKKLPYEYKQLFPRSGDVVSSELTLINGRPVQVLANGSYFNPEDLLTSGYWGWWEKLGTMLPFDYEPPKKK